MRIIKIPVLYNNQIEGNNIENKIAQFFPNAHLVCSSGVISKNLLGHLGESLRMRKTKRKLVCAKATILFKHKRLACFREYRGCLNMKRSADDTCVQQY